MFLVFIPLYFLSQAQTLEYLQNHFPLFYAWFVLPRTVIALEIAGLGLLGFALIELWNQRGKPQDNRPTTSAVRSPFQEPEHKKAASASIGDININLHQASQQAKEGAVHLPVLPPKAPKPEPNLKRFGTREAWVDIPLNSYYFEEVRASYQRALLAVYENEVEDNKRIGEVRDVVGQIRYSDEDGEEVQELRVQAGCWLGVSGCDADFPQNAKHELIIAIKSNNECQIIREARRHSSVKNIKFQYGRMKVHVKLLSSSGDVLLASNYLLISTQTEFSLTRMDE